MEPLSAATLVTLIGLAIDYLQEKRYQKDSNKSASIEEYKQYLVEKKHTQLVQSIDQNSILLHGLTSLFRLQHNELVEKIDDVQRAILQVANHLDIWKDITSAVPQLSQLSRQSIELLRELNVRQSSGAYKVQTTEGHFLVPMDGDSRLISISDPRFIDDDLATLTKLGLLIRSYDNLDEGYKITRLGAKIGSTA